MKKRNGGWARGVVLEALCQTSDHLPQTWFQPPPTHTHIRTKTFDSVSSGYFFPGNALWWSQDPVFPISLKRLFRSLFYSIYLHMWFFFPLLFYLFPFVNFIFSISSSMHLCLFLVLGLNCYWNSFSFWARSDSTFFF